MPPPTAVPCPSGSTITVEPGGQVELATPPTDPWWCSLDALRIDGAEVRRRLADAGMAVLAAGIDPFREPARTLHQAALRRHAGLLRRVGS